MQLSTTEKDELLNGVRNAAVACQTALNAFHADKSDAKLEAVYEARDAYHKALSGFLTEIEKGLNLDYSCIHEHIFAAIDSAVPAPEGEPEQQTNAPSYDSPELVNEKTHPDESTPDTGNI